MKIVLCSLNFWPEVVGIGKYSGELADWLANRGHSVRVITAPPYYPHWEVFKEYSGAKYSHEKYGNADVYRVPLWVPRSPTGLKRVLHLVSFTIGSLPLIFRQIFWRPDVFITIEPPLMIAPFVWSASKICKAKCLLHVQDFEVDAAFELGLLPNRFRIKEIVQKVEKLIMQRFDLVSTISERMLKNLQGKKIKKTRQIFFPNWVDTSKIFPQVIKSNIRVELNIPNEKLILLYSGNIGEKQGLDLIVDVAKIFKDDGNENFHFVFCGDGGARTRLKELAKDLKNISWIPLQPLEKLNDLLNMADIHLLPQKADAADLVMPSKLTGILASGRPVIATALAETQVAKTLQGIGMVIPPDNLASLKQAIETLGTNAEARNCMGHEARMWAIERLDKKNVLLQFEKDLEDCLKNNSRGAH